MDVKLGRAVGRYRQWGAVLHEKQRFLEAGSVGRGEPLPLQRVERSLAEEFGHGGQLRLDLETGLLFDPLQALYVKEGTV
jgi:hypothetical protein